MMTTRQLLADATGKLKDAGCDTPRLDAEVLLMHAWGIDKAQLVIRMDEKPDSEVIHTFQAMVQRRQKRKPVAYITGEKEFWSRGFNVSPDVLIPRPETEHLIEAILEKYPDQDNAYHFCDIGTGSGCLAVTLACEYPHTEVIATDISEAALSAAQENAVRHKAEGRIQFRHGDLFQSLLPSDEAFDAIVCNPPYVARDEYDQLEPELRFEPRPALTDEADGLRHLGQLIELAPAYLKPDGRLIVETGLCGLPESSEAMQLERKIFDLAGMLRGGIYLSH